VAFAKKQGLRSYSSYGRESSGHLYQEPPITSTKEKNMSTFKFGKITSRQEIEARCEAIEKDQEAYGDWLIQQQRLEEQKAYEARQARRAAKLASK
jgi:hypothetical protein